MIIKGKDLRLPKRLKSKWIKALRSGKYHQYTSGGLRRSNAINSYAGYCCLGVLCSIEGIPDDILNNYAMITGKLLANHKTKDKIPDFLIGDWSKIGNPIASKLASMNDSEKSFNYIASYIEKNL